MRGHFDRSISGFGKKMVRPSSRTPPVQDICFFAGICPMIHLLIWLVRLCGLLEDGGQDTIGPLEGGQVVRAVKLAQGHRLRVNHQRMNLQTRPEAQVKRLPLQILVAASDRQFCVTTESCFSCGGFVFPPACR